MKFPNSDRVLQQFLENPGKQYTASDLREYLMVPRGEKDRFRRLLDGMVRDGELVLSQKKYYRLVGELGEPGRQGRKGRRGRNEEPAPAPNRKQRREPVDRSAGGRGGREEQLRDVRVQGGRSPRDFGESRSRRKTQVAGAFGNPKLALPKLRKGSALEDPRPRRKRGEPGEEPRIPSDFQGLARLFLSRYGLFEEFGEEIDRQVANACAGVKAEIPKREDRRKLYTLCIDPEGARDHDDAVSVVPHKDGTWELWVHIADVSWFVAEGSPLDLEARDRAFTQYLPWQAVPMLPDSLSGDACSLMKDQDRLAFSCQMQVSAEGDVTEYRFAKTVIRVDDDPPYPLALERSKNPNDPCAQLKKLAEILRARREEQGVLELDMPESGVVFDEKNEPVRVENRVQIESMKWIEDCMLAANRCCAKMMKSRKLQGLYRVHPAPIPQDVLELFRNEPGLFEGTGFSPRRLFEALDSVDEGTPGCAVVPELFALFRKLVRNAKDDAEKRRMVLRAMQKARYSEVPMGHFALDWADYAHFTSPIRRYADLWCHRAMSLSLAGKKKRWRGLDEMAEAISEREIEVMKNERYGVKLCAAWIVKDRVGEEFDGKITGLSEWGMWVELTGTGAEGVVRYETIDGDWYTYDPEKDRTVGRRNRRIFVRGQALRVRLERVDLDRYELDLSMVLPEGGAAAAPEPPKKPKKPRFGRR